MDTDENWPVGKKLEVTHEQWKNVKEALESYRDENKQLKKALRTIMSQPFDGSWDAQAVFICQTLAKLP